MPDIHRNTKSNGHNSGGREALKSRSKGEKPSGGGVTRSSGTGGSHPGLES